MSFLRTRLPPPNTLVVFEAVARHLSFTDAANELRVTQAAVSRQVQLLEEFMGAPLFNRLYRSIELTPQGTSLYGTVSMGLEHIANIVDEIRRERDRVDITISSSVTFASYWLMSRIANYRAKFPDVDVRLVASTKTRDMTGTGIDLAVRYGRGTWPNTVADLMFGNDIFPVCAPSYIERHGPLAEFDDLLDATLLHLAQFDRNWVTWESWLDKFGAKLPAETKNLHFDNYMLLIHAAVRGEGVALCGGRLAEDLIGRGELVRPLDASLESEFSFYLLRPSAQSLRPSVAKFRDWLLAEATATRDT